MTIQLAKQLIGSAVIAVAICLLAAIAQADESSIKLKPGADLEAVEQNCGSCHSLDYIQMNSPFLDKKGWIAEVNKMVNAFGAPIGSADQQKIIAYLSVRYGKQ
jgi:mono/diheme cytochrome c family protein